MKKSLHLQLIWVVIILFLFPAIGIAESPAKPLQLSVFPPLQLHNQETDIRGLRLNLIYGFNKSLQGLDIGLILAELHVGSDCLVAGILYRAVREARVSREEVESGFGTQVADLVDGVLRMAAISDLRVQRETPVLGQADGQKDNIRKMLIALVDDVRTVGIVPVNQVGEGAANVDADTLHSRAGFDVWYTIVAISRWPGVRRP